MRCTILGSGSKGNCLLVEGATGALLIDAGFSARETFRRLAVAGRSPDTIEAILITHEHGDHVVGAELISRRLNIPVYGTAKTMDEFLNNRCRDGKTVISDTCKHDEAFCIGDFQVTPFRTSHDAADPCGFIVRENGALLGVCTDTGEVTAQMMEKLLRCDGVILESNHCPIMLRDGPYPELLKRRIGSVKGHLSNPDAADCLCRLGGNVPTIVLAHLSQINNTPEKAFASARNALGLLSDETKLIIASQKGPGPSSSQEFTL